MKFIRDIIAEKTGMAEEELADPVIRGQQEDRQEDRQEELDPVDMVASGGLSLGREGHLAYPTEDADQNGTGDGLDDPAPDGPDGLSDAGGERDADDRFDLMSGTRDTAWPTDSSDPTEPSELFADIWPEDRAEEYGAEYEGADPEEDVFAADLPDSDVEMAPADDMTLDDAPAPVPKTNAEALMHTMYKAKQEMSGEEPVEDQSVHADMPSATAESLLEDRAKDQVGSQGNSAFHRIMKRQQSMPPEPESVPTSEPQAKATPEPMEPVHVPAPAAGRARRQAGRVKTRLLGFSNDDGGETDLFAAGNSADPTAQTMFPVGWIVVTSGPGRGNAFALFNGVSQIGRGEDQAVRLDFGDNSISRSNHAAIAYDPEQKGFYLGHGGKTNLVRLNGSPVLSTEPLQSGAMIRIGETTLRFAALCGEDFDWDKAQEGEGGNARFG